MMKRLFLSEIQEPDWIESFLQRGDYSLETPEDRVRLTVRLAAENVRQKTGGPFAAIIFDRKAKALFSVGVNSVVPAGQSFAHAEMTAIAAAQLKFGSYDLGREDFELVSSCEPCVMCFGGTLWSGVKSLVYGAPGSFAAKIGFDEGDKVPDWEDSLRRRGLEVSGPYLGDEARLPFDLYQNGENVIY